jgi:hypothetical protein
VFVCVCLVIGSVIGLGWGIEILCRDFKRMLCLLEKWVEAFVPLAIFFFCISRLFR